MIFDVKVNEDKKIVNANHLELPSKVIDAYEDEGAVNIVESVQTYTTIAHYERVKNDDIRLYFVNKFGDSYEFSGSVSSEQSEDSSRKNTVATKFEVTGEKWIGLQQDSYEVKLYNIPQKWIASYIEDNFINLLVKINDKFVFQGIIINVVGKLDNSLTYVNTFTCLRKASIFLASIVNVSTSSSMNYYAILRNILGEEGVNIDENLVNYFPDSEIDFSGDRKQVIEEIINMINSRFSEDQTYYEIKYDESGYINIFDSKKSVNAKVYEISSETGMIGMPELSDNGLLIKHMYDDWILPGAIVSIKDPEFISTSNVTSAYAFMFDSQNLYTITHVNYIISTLTGQEAICEIEAYPYNKFQNWSTR